MRLAKIAIVRATAIGFVAGAWLILVGGMLLLPGRLGAPPGQAEGLQPPPVLAWNRVVTISTSPKGWWTFVTVESSQAGQPLEAAFVIQYDPPLSAAAAAFHGPARITAKDNALWVESSKGGGWLFGFPSFSSLFTRLTSVHGVVGIARYWGNLPRSHEEFVRQRLAAIPDSAVR